MNEEEKEVIEDMLNDEGAPAPDQEPESAATLGEIIREYVRKGNVTRIIIKRGDDILVNLPLNAGIVGGIIGAVAAPWALITAAIATAGFDCRVELVKTDGETVDLSPRKLGQKVADAGAAVVDEIRDVVDGIKTAAETPAQPEEAEDAEPAPDEEIPFDEPQSEE